ncbi:MAG: ornithine cyclodeaminase family protein [Anaerolineae bacterium]|nr:ornithine cyclodeaminase family protein [Anaerolineae bacterium]
MLFLNARDIMEALTLREVMGCVEEALRIYEDGTFVMPERMAVPCGEKDLLLLMPCVAMDNIVTKLVSVYPGNRARGRPVIDGIVVLYDRSTAEILGLMDGKTITAMRTGAVTGVSIAHLSKPGSRSVGLAGCGVQGYFQLLYACAAREICKIVLYDINPAAVPPLVDKLHTSLAGIEIEIAESSEALLRASDIVIAATTARKPIFPDDPELFVGKHCIAIGSFEPDVREYPDAVFSLVEKVWVDIDFAKEESGELLAPLQKGLLQEDQLETLGHFIQSGRAPERGAYGTTFSKAVGMALFDLTTARLAYANALERGLGTEL